MGNRAVITTEDKQMGVYLHWNGGRDSVEAFLDYCDLQGFRREYAENKTDAGATELPLNVCPFCGTGVMGEGRDAVHG